MHITTIVQDYLNQEESENFSSWAFGSECKEIYGFINFMKEWNERHSNKLQLMGNGHMQKDIPKMIEIWKQENGMGY